MRWQTAAEGLSTANATCCAAVSFNVGDQFCDRSPRKFGLEPPCQSPRVDLYRRWQDFDDVTDGEADGLGIIVVHIGSISKVAATLAHCSIGPSPSCLTPKVHLP
jgi:hypothetical protein